jgi:hypothetical protein
VKENPETKKKLNELASYFNSFHLRLRKRDMNFNLQEIKDKFS